MVFRQRDAKNSIRRPGVRSRDVQSKDVQGLSHHQVDRLMDAIPMVGSKDDLWKDGSPTDGLVKDDLRKVD